MVSSVRTWEWKGGQWLLDLILSTIDGSFDLLE